MNQNEDIAEKAYALVSEQLHAWGEDKDTEMYEEEDVEFDEEDEDDFDDQYSNDEEGYDYDDAMEQPGRESFDNSYASPDRSLLLRRRSSSGAYSRDGSVMSYDGSVESHESSSPFKFTVFHPLSSSNNAQKDNADLLEYHEILFAFLAQKDNLATQTQLDMANLSVTENDDDVRMDVEEQLQQGHLSIDLNYLKSLSRLCKNNVRDHSTVATSTSTSNQVHSSTRQMQLWQLIHLLRKQDGLTNASKNTNNDSFLLSTPNNPTKLKMPISSKDMYLSPPRILQKLLKTNFQFQRRYLLLRWISTFLLSNHQPIYLPPKSRDTMWPVSLHSKQFDMDPDAPLRNSSQQQDGAILPGTDEGDEIDFLKALLRLYQTNQFSKAIQLCDEVGQPWRASTFLGGLLTQYLQDDLNDTLKEQKDDDTDDLEKDDIQNNETNNDPTQKWNPHYFLWKNQCSKLAQQALTFSKESRTKEPPAVLYESALYSILSGDFGSAITNPLLRTWEDSVYIHFHALVHRMMDETLIQHCNLQRTVGKRFPFKGYSTSKKIETDLINRTLTASNMTEEIIFNSLSTSMYDDIRKESLDNLRVLTSCFIIGKNAVIDFIKDYVADVKSNSVEDSQKQTTSTVSSSNNEVLEYLPTILHLVLFLDNIMDSSDDIHEAAQVLLLEYMHTHLFPVSSLWKCVALYTSLISDENTQIVEYKNFLKSVKKKDIRKNMMERARSLLPARMDLNVVKMLLDETYVALSSDEMNQISLKDMKTRMNMIQWALFYPEHRFDAIWYANILLRQLLLEVQGSEGRYLNLAQEFLKSHFPRDSIKVVQKYYSNDEMFIEMDEEEVDLLMQDIHYVIEEHEGLCLYVNANSAYERWRLSLIQSISEIKNVVSSTSLPTYLQKGKRNKLNAAELEIAQQMKRREISRKVKTATHVVIEAAYNVEILLEKILKYPGGWLKRTDVEDENHREEMDELRKACLPRTASLWRKLCTDMGDFMESIALSSEGKSLFKDEERKDIFQCQYWYRKCMSIATVIAKEEYHIHKTFSNEELKEFLLSMRETNLKLLKVDYEADAV